MNRDRAFHQAVEQASQVYRYATIDAFDRYVRDCEQAGARYKQSEGDVLAAQDVCREEIEDAGVAYDRAVLSALEPYIRARDDALEAYRNTEK